MISESVIKSHLRVLLSVVLCVDVSVLQISVVQNIRNGVSELVVVVWWGACGVVVEGDLMVVRLPLLQSDQEAVSTSR